MPKEDFKEEKELMETETGRRSRGRLIYVKASSSTSPRYRHRESERKTSSGVGNAVPASVPGNDLFGVFGWAILDNGDPETLLFSMTRFSKFLPEEQRHLY